MAGWTGILQADAYGGYNGVYDAARKPAPVLSALCWSHARRKFFELADIKATARKGKRVAEDISPIALEAVKRIDAIFDVEREITGLNAAVRHDARQRLVRSMVEDLHDWMWAERARMSKHNPVAKAINYMLDEDGRWAAFSRFLDDGRICLTNNAAERALRCVALGRILPRRRPRRLHVFPDRYRQDERRRPSGLAGRCSCTTAGHDPITLARTPSLELAARSDRQSRITAAYAGWLRCS